MFDPGRMRERITIRRQANVKNARGGLTRSWTTLADNLSAEVVSIDGREAVIGQVLQGLSTYQITIRYRGDLKASDQVLWNGLELNIIAPPADRLGTRHWLTIHASTLAAQGA